MLFHINLFISYVIPYKLVYIACYSIYKPVYIEYLKGYHVPKKYYVLGQNIKNFPLLNVIILYVKFMPSSMTCFISKLQTGNLLALKWTTLEDCLSLLYSLTSNL